MFENSTEENSVGTLEEWFWAFPVGGREVSDLPEASQRQNVAQTRGPT